MNYNDIKQFEGMEVETIEEQLLEIHESDLRDLWKQYCDDHNNPDDYVYENDTEFLDRNFYGNDLYDILRIIQDSEDYDLTDEFVRVDIYNCLESSYAVENLIEVDDLAEHIYDELS